MELRTLIFSFILFIYLFVNLFCTSCALFSKAETVLPSLLASFLMQNLVNQSLIKFDFLV